VKRVVLSNEVRGSDESRWALEFRIGRREIAVMNKEQGIGKEKLFVEIVGQGGCVRHWGRPALEG
jgi:hypothetical protein